MYAYPNIACLMDVVVIDLPPAYGMFLTGKWSGSVCGSIQMDLSYALVPNAKGQLVILHREPYYLEHVEDFNEDELVDVVGFVEEFDHECEESMLDSHVTFDDEDVFYDASDDFLSWEDMGKDHEEVLSTYEQGSSSNQFEAMDELYDLLFEQGNVILVGDIVVLVNKDFEVTSQYHPLDQFGDSSIKP